MSTSSRVAPGSANSSAGANRVGNDHDPCDKGCSTTCRQSRQGTGPTSTPAYLASPRRATAGAADAETVEQPSPRGSCTRSSTGPPACPHDAGTTPTTARSGWQSTAGIRRSADAPTRTLNASSSVVASHYHCGRVRSRRHHQFGFPTRSSSARCAPHPDGDVSGVHRSHVTVRKRSHRVRFPIELVTAERVGEGSLKNTPARSHRCRSSG